MTMDPNATVFVPSTLKTLDANATVFVPAHRKTLNSNARVFVPSSKRIDIKWCSGNLGSRAHTIANRRLLIPDIFQGRIQNMYSCERTLPNCLNRFFGSTISDFDILCHQEVFMKKNTQSGIEDDMFDTFGLFNVASKQTGHIWSCHYKNLQTHQLFHGTTVAWNKNKFRKAGFVRGTGHLENRSTSWIILESLVNQTIQIVVSSMHFYIDETKNKEMWNDLQTDIKRLKNAGHQWIFVAGDFNKNYTETLSRDTSVNLVGDGSFTNYNVTFYDSTHHPSEMLENTYALSPTETKSTVDFQFVVGDNASVLSSVLHQWKQPNGLLEFKKENEMFCDYDHFPITSTIRLSF